MNVLMTYSSGYGSTKEVAERISKILAEESGLKITISSIDDVDGIQD